MKKRYLVTIFGLIFLFGLLLFYHAWRLFKFNEKIESSISESIAAVFDDQISIEDTELSWGILRIKNIIFTPPDQFIELWIENIDIEYELESFIFGGFRLKQTDKVTLVNSPRITFVFSGSQDDSLSITKLDPAKTLEPLFESLSQYAKYVQPVTISNGEVFKKNAATGERSKLFEKINGSAEVSADGKAKAGLAGKLVKGKQYVVFNSALDFANGRLDSLEVIFPEFQLTDEISSDDIPYIVLNKGVIWDKIKITQQDAGSHLKIDGNLSLKDGRFHLRSQGIVLDSVQINTTIADEHIHIHDTSFLLNGSKTDLSGSVIGFLEPTLDLYIESKELNTETFVKAFAPESDFPLSGIGKLQIAFKKSLKSPEFTGAFTADSLWLANQKLDDVNLRLAFRDSICTIQKFKAKNYDSAVNGWGSILFGKNDNFVSGTVVAQGDFTRSLHTFFQLEMPSVHGTALTEISGKLHSPTVDGKFAFDLAGSENSKLDLRGKFDISE
ncbi:MAG: hypothetical protein ACE5I1_31755, partial [bacterium]